MIVNEKHYRTIWMEGTIVKTIDQPKIPHKFSICSLNNYLETAKAISTMILRGAGTIGAAGAFGLAQAINEIDNEDKFLDELNKAKKILENTRPTAQDLFTAINEVYNSVKDKTLIDAKKISIEVSQKYADRNAQAGEIIGKYGAELIKDGFRILTHCNAGWLAFVDWGSALAPVYAAKRQGKKLFIYTDETRPRCQGSRLTAWELVNEKIEHAIIADNAAGFYMRKKMVDMVITGTDRIAANGDIANKIGTYEKALCAKANNIPFYIAAPTSTIDPSCKNGDLIPIEERNENEVLFMTGRNKNGELEKVRISPIKSRAKNPAFDVTPAELITAIITEKGIFKPKDILNAI